MPPIGQYEDVLVRAVYIDLRLIDVAEGDVEDICEKEAVGLRVLVGRLSDNARYSAESKML